MLPADPPLARKMIDHSKADVVTRALIFGSGIAKPDNEANARNLRLQNRSPKKWSSRSLLWLFFLRGGSGRRFRFLLLLTNHFGTGWDGFRDSGHRFFLNCGRQDRKHSQIRLDLRTHSLRQRNLTHMNRI